MEKINITKLKIREAKKADINSIYLLGKEIPELDFSKDYPFHSKVELNEYIESKKDNILLVAEIDNKIIGFLYAKIIERHEGGWCVLDNLAVKSELRKNGIGKALLNDLYSKMKKMKINYAQILVDINHKKARSFWKKMGYTETRTFIWAEREI
jgi:ribosomal protein S18 acetylase RimI-like enzyme